MARAPAAHPPSFPVARAPICGSPIRREKNRLIGVWKYPAFSRKNGRFSGKNTSKRWLIVTCGSSDSTWLKSGLAVRSIVTASCATNLASMPARPSVLWSKALSSRKRAPVKVPYGISWMLRPGDTPARPWASANCDEKPLMVRVIPGQNAYSLLTGMPRISATPQARPSPGGKRRLLNGIANDTT